MTLGQGRIPLRWVESEKLRVNTTCSTWWWLRPVGEVILADRIFNDAVMGADVRPLVAKGRLEKGLPIDPVEEYAKSEYQRRIESKRG